MATNSTINNGHKASTKSISDEHLAELYHFPKLRTNWLLHLWDSMLGPGWSRYEFLFFLLSFLAPVFHLWLRCTQQVPWNEIQYVYVVWTSFDIVGGALCLSMPSCKRWYDAKTAAGGLYHIWDFVILTHREAVTLAILFSPVATEMLAYSQWSQLSVDKVLLILREAYWMYAVVVYGCVIVGSIVVFYTPQRMQRIVATCFLMIAILANSLLSVPPTWEWFAPVFVFKLVYAHGCACPELMFTLSPKAQAELKAAAHIHLQPCVHLTGNGNDMNVTSKID
jgi:hypothetical protein